MSRMTRVRSGGLPLRVAPLIVALVLGASALAPMAAATAKPKAKHHTVHKRAKKHKAKHVAKPKTASETCTPTPATPGAIDSATQAFIAHLYAAHLSTSPAAQVQSILSDPNNYVLVHTALVQAMLSSGLSSATSIGSVLQGVTTPLFAHIYSAHLSQSPEQQVQSIVSNPDAYILLHTVWAESMLTPLTDWFEAVLGGAPGDSCPAGGGTGGSTGGAVGDDHELLVHAVDVDSLDRHEGHLDQR